MTTTAADDYRRARQLFLRELGREPIARLHRPIAWLDWAVVVGLPAVFVGNAVLLATRPIGAPWIWYWRNETHRALWSR